MKINFFTLSCNFIILLHCISAAQTDDTELDEVIERTWCYNFAWIVCLILKIAILVYLLGSLIVSGSMIPLFGCYETLQLLLHLPLISTEVPKMVIDFLLPCLDLVKFNFIPLNQKIREQWNSDEGYDSFN